MVVIPVFFNGALAAHDDQGAGKGEVGSERFDGKGMDVTEINASVAGLDLGKKGVSLRASHAWAC